MNTAMSVSQFVEEVYFPAHYNMTDGSKEQLLCAPLLLEQWAKRHVRIHELSDDLLSEFLNAYSKVRAPRTTNNKRASLLTIWKFAHQKGYVPNPPREVVKMRVPKNNPLAWSLEEFGRLLDVAGKLSGKVGPHRESDWFQALLILCFTTASRISGIMGLKSQDISLADRWCIIYEPKTRKEQVHRLSEQCVNALAKIWSEHRSKVFGDWPFDQKPHRWVTLSRRLKKCITLAGVPAYGVFHAIRRTSCTLIYVQDERAATKLLGHSCEWLAREHYFDKRFDNSTLPNDLLPLLPVDIAKSLIPLPSRGPVPLRTPRRTPVMRREEAQTESRRFAIMLKLARRERKLTQRKVGLIFGVPERKITEWERSRSDGNNVRIPMAWRPLIERWALTGTEPTAEEIAAAQALHADKFSPGKDARP